MYFFGNFANKFSKEKCNYHHNGDGGHHVKGKFGRAGKNQNNTGDHDENLTDKKSEVGGEGILNLGNIGTESA